MLVFQLSLWPVTPSFGISVKERRVIGTVEMKYNKNNNIKWNTLYSTFHLIFPILIYRYECPAGCIDATGKVVGTVHYEMVSTQIHVLILRLNSPNYAVWLGGLISYIGQLTAVWLVQVSLCYLLTTMSANGLHVVNKMFSILQQSSVCRAGLHAGVIDNDGGWMDVTRQGRKEFFIKSNKNGVQSLGWDNNNRNSIGMNLFWRYLIARSVKYTHNKWK